MQHKILVSAGMAVLSLSLAACASNPDRKTVNNNSSQEVCTYHAQIGSHIGSRRCVSRKAYDAQQKADNEKTQTRADMGGGSGGSGWRR